MEDQFGIPPRQGSFDTDDDLLVPLSPRTLRGSFTQFIEERCPHSIFATIHLNSARRGGDAAVRRARSGDVRRDIDESWSVTRKLLYRLDQLHKECPNPEHLAPNDRFQGFVVLEKRTVSPHFHLLLCFNSAWEQAFAYGFLLQVLDNVPAVTWHKAKERDLQREMEEWTFIREHGTTPLLALYGPKSSCLTEFASSGVAKVLPVYGDIDRRRVSAYITKELERVTPASLAARKWEDVNDEYFDFRELREFHSKKGVEDPARFWTIDPENPRMMCLNLDKPLRWRCKRAGSLRWQKATPGVAI